MENWDNTFETYEEFEKRMALDNYYGDYSASVKQKLVAKNLPKVSNVYDVLYVNVREDMLAKNKSTIKSDDTTSSDLIRINNLKQNIKKEIDLLSSGEIYRNNNLTKNSLIDTATQLETIAKDKRKELLSKNPTKNLNIDSYGESARNLEITKNVSNNLNIDTYANGAKQGSESKNIKSNINIDTYAINARNSDLSVNKNIGINIDTYSNSSRNLSLSKNIPSNFSIDNYSTQEKNREVSSNIPSTLNIDTYAGNQRNSDLSVNVPISVNIDTYAGNQRNSEISSNIPSSLSIDTYASNARSSEISANIASILGIDTYSSNERAREVSSNIPSLINIDTYSNNERAREVSSNIPFTLNIDTYASNERALELSSNVAFNLNIDTYASNERAAELSTNVHIPINIDTYASNERATELSTNVHIPINIDTYANNERAAELSTNVHIPINIDTYAELAYIENVSSNVPSFVNIDTYAGEAYVENTYPNVPSAFSIDKIVNSQGVLSLNYFATSEDVFQYNTHNRNKYTLTNSNTYLDYIVNNLINPETKQPVPLAPTIYNGVSSINDGYDTYNKNILNYELQYQNSLLNLSSDFDSINSNARLYNLGRNYYSLINSPGGIGNGQLDVYRDNLENLYNKITGIPSGLIDYTTTYYDLFGGSKQKINEQTNATLKNYSAYIGGTVDGADNLLKPLSYSAGTAGSMMTNTQTQDLISNNFLNGEIVNSSLKQAPYSSSSDAERGVRKIINTIANSNDPKNLTFAQNFKTNQTEFIVGQNVKGMPKKTYQRYTYSNPSTSDSNLGRIPKLAFSIKNYSMPQERWQLSFPPYIKSYSDTAKADFTSHDFLGRPESVYTYSKSNRAGQISFVVLTDFAESVEMGWLKLDNDGNLISNNTITNDFSNVSFTNAQYVAAKKSIESQIASLQKSNAGLNNTINNLNKNSNSNNSTNTSTYTSQISTNNQNISNLQNTLQQVNVYAGANPYKEQNGKGGKLINATSQYHNTVEMVNMMKKNLMFQPAFFSGSKVDFKNKMEFLMKLTRPAVNPSVSGFAFTKPPIAHIVLGNWFNSDVIINSVSMDYSDAPWTLDIANPVAVQPMWATVTLDFTFIGSYGGGGTPVLSTDIGGFYSFKDENVNAVDIVPATQAGQSASSTSAGGSAHVYSGNISGNRSQGVGALPNLIPFN